MFRYGLVGNLATYGGITAIFGYVAYELNNIIELSPKLSEELATEVLDPKKSPNISMDAKADMRKAAAKQILQEFQQKKKKVPLEAFEQIEQKYVPKSSQEADI